jgi:hypothetical protein
LKHINENFRQAVMAIFVNRDNKILIRIDPGELKNYETLHRAEAYHQALQIYGLLPEII